MDQYLLVVSDNENGFTVNAICEALNKHGIKTLNISVNGENLTDHFSDAFGVLLVDTFENTFVMNAIKNKCYETGKKVMLYGSPECISTMKRTIIDSVIYKELLRPVEMEELIHDAKKLALKMENQDVMKKILVVDDDGLFLRTMMEWLDGKYIVSLANSAGNATNAIKSGVPDLILMDYEMPLCSGAQLMELFAEHESTKNIPIIFLTSRCDEETVKEVMKLKPKGYILKTATHEQLLKKLEDFFDSQLDPVV